MLSLRSFKYLIMLLSLSLFSACGGNGGKTNGILVLSLPGTVAAGKTVTATATLNLSTGQPINNLHVKYFSDNESVIPSTVDPTPTTISGFSQMPLLTKNVSNTAVTVNVYAEVGGVVSNTVAVIVNPAKLTLTPPASATISETADSTTKLCGGGIKTLVISGATVKFTDSSLQNVSGQPVTIAVTSLTNGVLGFDQVVLFPSGSSIVIIPPFPNSVTNNTDNNGIWYLPITIDGIAPTNKDGQHVFTVNWEATALRNGDDGVTIQYRVTGQTMLTLSCS